MERSVRLSKRWALSVPQLLTSTVFPPFACVYTTLLIHVAVLSLAAVCVYYLSQLDAEQVANPPEANVVFVILGCGRTPARSDSSLVVNLDQSGSLAPRCFSS